MELQEINEVIGHVPGERDALAAGTSRDALAAGTSSVSKTAPSAASVYTAV